MAFLMAFLSAIMVSVAQLCLKIGAAQHVAREGAIVGVAAMARLLSEPWVLAGLALYGICALAWLWVLSRLPVSDAYPILSLTFVFVPLMAKYGIGERIAATYWIGAALIVIGVMVLLSGAQTPVR